MANFQQICNRKSMFRQIYNKRPNQKISTFIGMGLVQKHSFKNPRMKRRISTLSSEILSLFPVNITISVSTFFYHYLWGIPSFPQYHHFVSTLCTIPYFTERSLLPFKITRRLIYVFNSISIL